MLDVLSCAAEQSVTNTRREVRIARAAEHIPHMARTSWVCAILDEGRKESGDGPHHSPHAIALWLVSFLLPSLDRLP